MNKEQQIKEMLLAIPQKIVAYDMNPKGQHLYGEQRQQIAETLYNAGYRKVPDCAVILTPEERDEELKACNEKQAELEAKIEILKIQNNNLEIAFDRLNARTERFESNMKSVLEIEKKNAVKEFAQKLKEKFGDYEVWHYDGENEAWHDLQSEIDECVKEYTE